MVVACAVEPWLGRFAIQRGDSTNKNLL